MPNLLRIFVSSPGDVIAERRRAQLVIEKLAKEYARFFIIEAELWEVEPMLASGHFQDQIVPPSETDIVVLIVWSRLGTPLPPKTETREYRGIDDRVPVTGTEWEFEDALAAQKARGAPDLLAYRKQVPAMAPLSDEAVAAEAKEQWEKLNGFWDRWFVDRGSFRAAFNNFDDLDGFEVKLESDLRHLIEARIHTAGSDQTVAAPIWLTGSPFRGLESYRFEHAPIFFGRSAMIKAAVEQLSGNAEAGHAFLLVLGASGAGKSSLVQAGVLPALTGRGIVPGVGLWRRALMQPGGHARGPFAALAEALLANDAVPELRTDRQDSTALAKHLKAAAEDPSFPIVNALDRIERAARDRGDMLRIETARLALLVDQLEELFTASDVGTADRVAFVRCLDGLARCGRVFVLATMRSDYWHRATETPELVAMAAGNGRLDLLPPVQDEILEMIRQPAAAAGLSFERDPARGIGLDATLATEAATEPGALPLLSFLLDALYKADVQNTGRSTLTYASVQKLGGLTGAIANQAEAAFTALPPDAQAAFPKVLRALVTVSHTGAEPTARAALMERFPAGTPARQLVDALLDPHVRLIVADGDGEGARVRLAHEALITRWQLARDQLALDRRDLETRDLVERQQVRWAQATGRVQQQLLLHDPDLTNAVDLNRRWDEELAPELRGFIARSTRAATAAARRRWIAAAAAMLSLAVLSSALAYLWHSSETSLAKVRTDDAEMTVDEAQRLLGAGDIDKASVLARKALATDGSIPFIPAAYRVLYSALFSANPNASLDIGPYSRFDSSFEVRALPSGLYLTVAPNRNIFKIWSPTKGVIYSHFEPNFGLSFSVSPNSTAVFFGNGSGGMGEFYRFRPEQRAFDKIELNPFDDTQKIFPGRHFIALSEHELLGCTKTMVFAYTFPNKSSGTFTTSWRVDLRTDLKTQGECSALGQTADGKIVVGTTKGEIVTFGEPGPRDVHVRQTGFAETDGSVEVDVVNPAGHSLLVGSGLGNLHYNYVVFSRAKDLPILKFASIDRAHLSADGRHLVSGPPSVGDVGQLLVANLQTGRRYTLKCTCEFINFADENRFVTLDHMSLLGGYGTVSIRTLRTGNVTHSVTLPHPVDNGRYIARRNLFIGLQEAHPATLITLGRSARNRRFNAAPERDIFKSTFINNSLIAMITGKAGNKGSFVIRGVRITPKTIQKAWEKSIKWPSSISQVGSGLIGVVTPDDMSNFPAKLVLFDAHTGKAVVRAHMIARFQTDHYRDVMLVPTDSGPRLFDLRSKTWVQSLKNVHKRPNAWALADGFLLEAFGDDVEFQSALAGPTKHAIQPIKAAGHVLYICPTANGGDAISISLVNRSAVTFERWNITSKKRTAHYEKKLEKDQLSQVLTLNVILPALSGHYAQLVRSISCKSTRLEIKALEGDKIIWSAESNTLKIKPLKSKPTGRQYTLNGHGTVFISTAANSASLIEESSGKVLMRTPPLASKITSTVLAARPGWLAAGSEDGMLHVWDFDRHPEKPIIALRAGDSPIAHLDVNPSQTLLLTGDSQEIRVWPILSPTALKQYASKD